jgi:hypothetical protein
MGGGSTTAKTTSYTLVAADAGTVVQMNSASSTTITVNTALFAAGDTVQIQNIGVGVCTVTAGTATVNTAGSLALSQYENGTLYFTATGASLFFDTTQASSSGGMTLISTTAVTATASVDMTSIPQTYKDLIIYVSGVYENSGAGQALTWNNYTSGFSYNVIQASNANTVTVSTSASSINLGGSLRFVAGSGSGSMAIRIPNYTDTAMQKICSWFMGGGNGATTGSGSYGGIAAITSVKITWAGTPTAAGNVYLYGVN